MSRKRGGNSAKRRDSKADNNELHFPSRSVRLISAADEKPLHRAEDHPWGARTGKSAPSWSHRENSRASDDAHISRIKCAFRSSNVEEWSFSSACQGRLLAADWGEKDVPRSEEAKVTSEFLPAKRLFNNVKRVKTVGISREIYLKSA